MPLGKGNDVSNLVKNNNQQVGLLATSQIT